MILIDDVKYACLECIRGHRLTLCRHHFRPLLQVRSKGRPIVQSGNNQNYRVAVFAEEVENAPSLNGNTQPCERAPVVILKASPKQVIDICSGRIVGPYQEEDFLKAASTSHKPPPVISSDSFVANQICCSKSLVPRPIDRVSKSCGCNRQRNLNKNTILRKFLSKKRTEEMKPMKKDTSQFEHDSRDLDFGLEQVVFLSLENRASKNSNQVTSGDGSQVFDVFKVPGCSIDGLCCCNSKCSCIGCEKHGNFPLKSSQAPHQDWRGHRLQPDQVHGINQTTLRAHQVGLSSHEHHASMSFGPHAQQNESNIQTEERPFSIANESLIHPSNTTNAATNITHVIPPSLHGAELTSSDIITSNDKMNFLLPTGASDTNSYMDTLYPCNRTQQLPESYTRPIPQQYQSTALQGSSSTQAQTQPLTHAATLQFFTRLLSEQPNVGSASEQELEGGWDRGCQCPENSCECVNCETHGNLNGYRLDDIFRYEVAQENAIAHANMISEQTLRDMLMNDSRSNSVEGNHSDERVERHRFGRSESPPISKSTCCMKNATVNESSNVSPLHMATPPISQGPMSNENHHLHMPFPDATNISASSNLQNAHSHRECSQAP